jgi:hypothetical protein
MPRISCAASPGCRALLGAPSVIACWVLPGYSLVRGCTGLTGHISGPCFRALARHAAICMSYKQTGQEPRKLPLFERFPEPNQREAADQFAHPIRVQFTLSSRRFCL